MAAAAQGPAVPLFNGGQPMNFDQRVDRQQVCVQLLCTGRMSDWCPDLTTLAANVNINLEQLTQLREHLTFNQPALEKRIKFTLELQNRPAPNNAVNNPVDRHFGPEAQSLLRQLYLEDPDRDANAIKKLFKTNPALYENSPHNSRETIHRQGRTWWQRQNEITGDSSKQNLIPGMLFEEEFLLWSCIFYLREHVTTRGNMNILAENMWTYNGTEMENKKFDMHDVWNDFIRLFTMAEKINNNQVGTEVRRRQEEVDATIKPISDFKQAWVEKRTRDQLSDDEKDDMMYDINIALNNICWVNYYMYVHGPLQQMFLRIFMERLLRFLQPLAEIIHIRYQTAKRHEALHRAYARKAQLLYLGHRAHKRQLDSLTQLCQWFQTNIDTNRDLCSEVPEIPDWATDTEWETIVSVMPTRHPEYVNVLD